jgi:hypothetical protein
MEKKFRENSETKNEFQQKERSKIKISDLMSEVTESPIEQHHSSLKKIETQKNDESTPLSEIKDLSHCNNINDSINVPVPFSQISTISSSNEASMRQEHKKRKRRKYCEIERNFSCTHPGCGLSYGTLNHLNHHIKLQVFLIFLILRITAKNYQLKISILLEGKQTK